MVLNEGGQPVEALAHVVCPVASQTPEPDGTGIIDRAARRSRPEERQVRPGCGPHPMPAGQLDLDQTRPGRHVGCRRSWRWQGERDVVRWGSRSRGPVLGQHDAPPSEQQARVQTVPAGYLRGVRSHRAYVRFRNRTRPSKFARLMSACGALRPARPSSGGERLADEGRFWVGVSYRSLGAPEAACRQKSCGQTCQVSDTWRGVDGRDFVDVPPRVSVRECHSRLAQAVRCARSAMQRW